MQSPPVCNFSPSGTKVAIPPVTHFDWVGKIHHGQRISVPRFQCTLCHRWFSLNHPLDHFKKEHGLRVTSTMDIPGIFHDAVTAARKRLPLPLPPTIVPPVANTDDSPAEDKTEKASQLCELSQTKDAPAAKSIVVNSFSKEAPCGPQSIRPSIAKIFEEAESKMKQVLEKTPNPDDRAVRMGGAGVDNKSTRRGANGQFSSDQERPAYPPFMNDSTMEYNCDAKKRKLDPLPPTNLTDFMTQTFSFERLIDGSESNTSSFDQTESNLQNQTVLKACRNNQISPMSCPHNPTSPRSCSNNQTSIRSCPNGRVDSVACGQNSQLSQEKYQRTVLTHAGSEDNLSGTPNEFLNHLTPTDQLSVNKVEPTAYLVGHTPELYPKAFYASMLLQSMSLFSQKQCKLADELKCLSECIDVCVTREADLQEELNSTRYVLRRLRSTQTNLVSKLTELPQFISLLAKTSDHDINDNEECPKDDHNKIDLTTPRQSKVPSVLFQTPPTSASE